MKTLRTFPGQRVALGHQGENFALTVIFNIGAWVDSYGPGTVHLAHMRNGDSEAYPVAVTQVGTEVSWEVSDADTAVDGYGKYELRYIVGETVVKSSVGETYVRKALQNGAEPPEPVQSWVDHMTEKEHELLEAVGEAKEASEKAAGAAGDALTFANAAAQAAGSAEEAARNAALAAQNVSDLADNARLSAKAAADQAGQAAGSAKEAKDAVEEARNIVDGADVVKSVNGQTPDENGNVRIEVGSGSGVDVTAKPGQLIRVQAVDENGKPTAWEAVPWGYTEGETIHPIPGELLPKGVPYVEKGFIFEETDMVEFTHPSFGKMWGYTAKAPNLTVGETYTVIYNGVPYDCVCHAGEDTGVSFAKGAFALGNFAAAGGENTGEPFAMLIFPSVPQIAIIDLSSATSVRIGIMGKVGHKIDPMCLPVLTVTVDTSSMTADKTHDEIYTAVKAGRTVLLFYGNDIGSFVSASTFDACFVVTTTSLGTSGVSDVIKTFVIVHEIGEVFTFEE